MNKFGKLIQTARYKKKLSQGELARKMGFDTPQYISNLERGAADCSGKMAARLADLLDIPRVTMFRIMFSECTAKNRLQLLRELGL